MAAENRYQRLKTQPFNVAQLNHRARFRIINNLLKKIKFAQRGIDVGTGTGVWAEVLLNYCENVTGIDFAQQNIKIACNNAVQHNLTDRLTYILGDAEELQGVDDSFFDVAMHISVLQHLPNHKRALERVNDILRENGYLIILVHNRSCIYNRNVNLQRKKGASIAINKYHNLEEVTSLLETTGFQIQEIHMCWLLFFDFLFFGFANNALKPFMPLRKALLALLGEVSYFFGRFRSLNFLFREIIIVAQKQTKNNASKIR